MRRASKPPSEWLKLLCKEWAIENEVLVETADAKFLDYKPFLKGILSSQLLCRLSVPATGKFAAEFDDFWEILGVADAFDRAYIVAQVCMSFSMVLLRHVGSRILVECLFLYPLLLVIAPRSNDFALCIISVAFRWTKLRLTLFS
jgi:hypothetical protein